MPYTDFEYAYGLLFIYFPAYLHLVLSKIGFSIKAAYYISYTLIGVISLLTIAYIINVFEISRRLKTWLFIALAFLFMNESMGLQYLPLRCVLPMACLIFLNRHMGRFFSCSSCSGVRPYAVFCGLSMLTIFLNLVVSPETGISFLLALTAYALYLAWSASLLYVVALLPGLAVVLVFLKLFSVEYFRTLLSFAAGGNLFPVVPTLYIMLYLASLFYLVPILINAVTEHREWSNAIWIGFAVLVVDMMGGALGRCDFGHVLLYGFPVFVLTPLSLARVRPGYFTKYCTIMFVIFLIFKLCHFGSAYSYQIGWHIAMKNCSNREMVRMVMSRIGIEPLRIRKWEQQCKCISDYSFFTNRGPMCAPFGANESLFYMLISRNLLAWEYFDGFGNLFTESDLDRKRKDLAKCSLAVVPKSVMDDGVTSNGGRRGMNWLFLYPFNWVPAKKPFEPGTAIKALLKADYTVLDEIGDYKLMVRKP